MNYVGKLFSNLKGYYGEINSSTLTGAIDVVVVRQEDGTLQSSPFHVRFGKIGVLRPTEKMVDIEINDAVVDVAMKLGDSGEAFFVDEDGEASQIPDHLATSPIKKDADEFMKQGLAELHKEASTVITIETAGAATQTGSHESQVHREDSQVSLYYTSAADQDDLDPRAAKKDVAIQTDMSGREAEVKAHQARMRTPSSDRVRTSSVDSQSCSSSAPTGGALADVSSSSSSLIQTVVAQQVARSKRASRRQRRRERRKSLREEKDLAQALVVEEQVVPQEEGVFSMDTDDAQPGTSAAAADVTFTLDPDANEDDDDVITEIEDSFAALPLGRTVSVPTQLSEGRADEWAGARVTSQFHPFSDGDITPITSPIGSRPPTPKSDTEFEKRRSYTRSDTSCQTAWTGDDMQNCDELQWEWGELPTNINTPQQPRVQQQDSGKKEPNHSGGYFTFMRETKKLRQQPQTEGIYLDELQLDSEVAALYIYPGRQGGPTTSNQEPAKDEDCESGRGASLPHSPLSMSHDSGMDYLANEANGHQNGGSGSPRDPEMDLSMSLCGGLQESELDITQERFFQHLVTYDQFIQKPDEFVNNPNLVIRWNNKYYNWSMVAPMFMSLLAFQRPLPPETCDSLVKTHMPKKKEARSGWLWWGRSVKGSSTNVVGSSRPDNDAQQKPGPSPSTSPPGSDPNSPEKPKTQRRRRRRRDGEVISSSESSDEMRAPHVVHAGRSRSSSPSRRCRKSLKLTQEQLKSLPLQDGVNKVRYSVSSQFQGTSECVAYIYLWNFDDRLVVSDIDGTITRSDVLGHVLPMIGKDWSQAGIAHLYNEIYGNGYKFLYLSARALGQAHMTREYLRSVKQDQLTLPDGPVLLSPSSLLSAFHKEVIERKPEEFKIGCLRDIAALFPPARNPFYAGYGNKINDTWAYRAVGIPISRIFTVNHKGELKNDMSQTFQSSYENLSEVVDQVFPPLSAKDELDAKTHVGNFPAPDEYSTFTYWREPLPDVTMDIPD